MKSFKLKLAASLLALGLGFSSPAMAAGSKYYVALTTVPVNGTAGEFAANYPNVSGAMYVRKIIVANSTATTAQTISIYDTCTSTSAGALKLEFYSGFAGMIQPALQEIDFLPQSFKLTSPCFKKSATGSTVDFTILYE
jgi:hypothetical protein